jgi:transcription elongation regulator 1
MKFLEECSLSSKTTFTEFSAKFGKDERFKGVDKSRERESLFNEHLIDLRRREKEERIAKREQIRKEYVELLKESSEVVDRHSSWSDVKKKLESDPRYKAVESSREREDYFLDHLHDLKDEYRRGKDKKKERHRSRSRSRSRRSRSRSHTKKSRSRSRDRDSKKKKSRKRSRSRDERRNDVDDIDVSAEKRKRKEDKHEKEEGEMSEEEDDYEK